MPKHRMRPPRLAPALIAAALVAALIPTPARWVEAFYSRQLYPVVQGVVTPVSSRVGFSLLDPLAVLLLAGLAVWWWRALRPSRRSRLVVAAGRMTLNTLAVAAALYLVFVAIWGLNYRREPLTAMLDYEPARVTPVALRALAGESIRRLDALYEPAVAREWPAFDALPSRLRPAFTQVQRRLGAARVAVPGRPKRSVLSLYFERAGIDGMMNPFALEVLVNQTVLPYERPFLLAHEWAHLAGFAHEADASFVGFLTCLAGDRQSRYSAWLFLAPQIVRHLPEHERAAVWAELDDGPRRHLTAIAERLGRAVPLVRRGANRVYDRFLRANRVDEGIASYGRVVDLLLGTDGSATWRGLLEPVETGAIAPAGGDMITRAIGERDVQTGDHGQGRGGQRRRSLGEVSVGG